MFGIIFDLYIASTCAPEIGFKLAWKRARHMRYGCPYHNSILIDKLQSEKHPHTDHEWIYTINLRECKDCGLIFQSCGVERKKR